MRNRAIVKKLLRQYWLYYPNILLRFVWDLSEILIFFYLLRGIFLLNLPMIKLWLNLLLNLNWCNLIIYKRVLVMRI